MFIFRNIYNVMTGTIYCIFHYVILVLNNLNENINDTK